MVDIGFRAVNLGGLPAILAAIGSQTNAFMAQTNREMERTLKAQYGNLSGGLGQHGSGLGRGPFPDSSIGKFGPAVRSTKIAFDSLNNTMRITNEMGMRIGKTFISMGNDSFNRGNFAGLTRELGNLGRAYERIDAYKRRSGQVLSRADAAIAGATTTAQAPYLRDIGRRTDTGNFLASERQRLTNLESLYRSYGASVPRNVSRSLGGIVTAINRNADGLTRATTRMRNAVSTALGGPGGLQATRDDYAARSRAELLNQGAIFKGIQSQVRKEWNAPSQAPSNVMATLNSSPQLQSMLMRAGLGGGAKMNTPAFNQSMQSANFSAPYMDLIRGTTKVSGEFFKTLKDGSPQLVRFGAEIDKNGRVITRFGGQMSGLSGFLRMIQRDFVKVIEWTIATTAVIGGMGAIISTVKQINEVDKLLRRFAITAQMTAQETKQYFGSLAKVAYETATPLNEMVKVADDMALSTKRTGQTTADWTRRITEMSNAVGILTNISGLDTTGATEQLTAMMKQLGVETNQLVGVLNKITAVAGGQQQAVADITKGLAVMAEAGKSAGLTVDQQIATVQVLSQVTSKSSSEVATAFKNLVGSIDSAGSIKILNEFGIQVRDAEGNAKNFLLIYKEIQDAIESGAIPAGRVKEVIKGISGGPRRAPDAAALLSNVNSIFEVEQTSINATNEALLANAKILDTNNAKLTQLKVRLDEIAFEKFAGVLKETLGSLTTILDNILKFFDGISVGAISTVLQITAFLAVSKLISVGIRAMIGFMEAFTFSILGAVAAAKTLRTQLAPIPTSTTPSGTTQGVGTWGRAKGLMGSKLTPKAGLAGAAIGVAGLAGAAMSGGSPLQMLGGGLQMAGAITTGLGAVVPHALIAGIALMGVGTVLQMISGDAKETTKELDSNSEAILNAATAYNLAKTSTKNLVTQQENLVKQIAQLAGKTDADSILASDAAKSKLAETTAKLVTTNYELNASFVELTKTLATSGTTGLPLTPGIISAIQQGTMSGADSTAIQKQLELAYLKQKYPEKYLDVNDKGGLDLNFGGPMRSGPTMFETGRISARGGVPGTGIAPTPGKVSFMDIAGFGTDINNFKTLFKDTPEGLKVIEGIPKNLQTSAILWEGINTLSKENAVEAEKYRDALIAAGYAQDNITQAAEGYLRLEAQLNTRQALGKLSPEQVTASENQYRFLQNILGEIEAQSIKSRTPSTDRYGRRTVDQGDAPFVRDRKQLEKMMLDTQDPSKRMVPGSSTWADQLELMTKYMPQLKDMDLSTQVDTIRALGGNIIYLGKSSKQAAADEQLLIDRTEELEDAQKSLNQSLADTSASLYDQFINGDLTASKYAEMEGRVKNYQASSEGISKGLTKSPGTSLVSDINNKQWDAFVKMMEKIPGFANAAELSITDLVGKIITTGTNTNTSADSARDWGKVLQWVKTVIDDLPTYKEMTYTIRMQYLYGNGTSAQPGIIERAQQIYRASHGGRSYTGSGTGEDPAWDAAVSKAKKEAGPIDLPTDTTTKPPVVDKNDLPGAAPSTGGGGKDTGVIDIPEEWKEANVDVSAYLQRAIAWAKKYQSAIPGENKEHAKDLVAVMLDNKRIWLQLGLSQEVLNKGIGLLTDEIKKQNDLLSKADTIRRIRVGAGDFAALANVPMNSKSGVSIGDSQGPISVNIDVNGQLLTPAQMDQLVEKVAAAIKAKLT